MSKILICQQSGTVLYVEHCVIVDTDDLTAEDAKTLFEGGDSDAMELADEKGKELKPILDNCGYGDLNYSNCIAFSPLAIQQELETNSEFFFGDDEEMTEYFTSLSKEALEEFASCLNSDYMWDTFTSEIQKEIEDQWETHKEGN